MYILAIDQGTTSSRCILYNEQAKVVAQVSQEFRQIFRKPGWVEHDADEIFDSVMYCFNQVLQKASIQASQIAAIGITNQRETTVLWSKSTGKPLANAIVWQSRQSSYICDRIIAQGYTEQIKNKTGLLPDSYFSASKLTWLFEQSPELRSNLDDLAFGTIDSWLIWKLSGGKAHLTDISNASRTMLFNINTCQWDDELLSIFGVPAQILPEVKENIGFFTNTDASITGSSIPISGVAGDQQAALFGQACFHEGMAKNTYGTGCFMLMQTGEQRVNSDNGLLATIAWKYKGKVSYALEGSVFVAGSAIQWLRDGLGLFNDNSEIEKLASSVPTTGGVYFVPAFVGLGAPYWDSNVRGAFFGLTRGTSKEHMIRAALEAIAFQTKDVFDLMQNEAGIKLKTLRVDGGASANNLMMQFQSEVLKTEVDRPVNIETTAYGVALMAGLAEGIWKDFEELAALRKKDAAFTPSENDSDLNHAYRGWKNAVKAARVFHENDDDF
ncbi:MAG: glycerol kinase GlpK [Bacteroidia bacterium]